MPRRNRPADFPAVAGDDDLLAVLGEIEQSVALTSRSHLPMFRASQGSPAMKIVNSLKTLKKRDKNCRVVRRRGRVFVINKQNPRFKARQG